MGFRRISSNPSDSWPQCRFPTWRSDRNTRFIPWKRLNEKKTWTLLHFIWKMDKLTPTVTKFKINSRKSKFSHIHDYFLHFLLTIKLKSLEEAHYILLYNNPISNPIYISYQVDKLSIPSSLLLDWLPRPISAIVIVYYYLHTY